MAKKTAWDWALTSGLSTGIGKKKDGNNMITPEPYNGPRPWTPDQVGLGTDKISPLATQYLNQISERSQGKGLVGYDPEMLGKEHQNINADFDYEDKLAHDRMTGQAASQGLRGGIPLTIGNEYMANSQRNRRNALNTVDISNLEANRADRNTATYAQPQLVNQASGMQDQAANFGLAEYNATQPTYIDQPPSNVAPAAIGAVGQLGSAYLASQNPYAAVSLQLAQQFVNQNNANKSTQRGTSSTY